MTGQIVTTTLVPFLLERERVRVAKENGVPAPWTDDPIIRKYRFCNVRREDDRVTRWVAANWRDLDFDDYSRKHNWFAMCVARLFNLPETLEAIQYPVPWAPKRAMKILSERKKAGKQIFNGAYIVSTNGVAMEKTEYVVERVLNPLWENKGYFAPNEEDTLGTFAGRLGEANGFKGFMVGQVVADIKYSWPLKNAADWHTWSLSGPGSRRGLNRVFGLPVDKPMPEEQWHAALLDVRSYLNRSLPFAKKNPLHAQDVQNCLCEFDKYERARLGQGRPKATYSSKK